MLDSLLPARGSSSSSSRQSSFRPDIQGLRAFAVIVVILDHLAAWPSGGFVGVDVFFVISGFLITGHLLREYEKTGHISFVSFYKKRAKRILPASILVVIATLAASFMIFNQTRMRDTLWDGLWSLLFGANWRFAAVGTDYFAAEGPVSPLQHFWSLAVEEQFYFIWPWLLLLAFTLFLRGRLAGSQRAARSVAGLAIAVISVASLAWALAESASNPGLAYFSTASRGWELGVGAGLAVAVPALRMLPMVARPLIAWTGIAGLIASLFLISETTLFPAPGAILPVLSAAAVIAASVGVVPHRSLFVLTNPVSRYLGDVSYSLYLWHFPVVIIAATLYPAGGLAYYGVVLAVITLLSVFAYHLWEDPVRRSDWLSGKRKWLSKVQISETYKHTALAFLACATAVVVAAALIPREQTAVVAPPAAASVKLAETASPEDKASQALINLVSTSVGAQEFPETNPSMEDPAAWMPEEMETSSKCLNPPDLTDTSVCTYGQGDKLAVVVGDSVAVSWVAAVAEALGPKGYRVHGIGLSDCPFAHVEIALQDNPQRAASCNASKSAIEAQIRDLKPDLLITTDFEGSITRLASGSVGEAAISEYTNGLVAAIKMAQGYGVKVAVLAPNPSGVAAAKCITKVGKPSDCLATVNGALAQKDRADKAAANQTNSLYIDSRPWFCTPTGECPLVVGKILTRWDHVHLTKQYAVVLGKFIGPRLTPPA